MWDHNSSEKCSEGPARVKLVVLALGDEWICSKLQKYETEWHVQRGTHMNMVRETVLVPTKSCTIAS